MVAHSDVDCESPWLLGCHISGGQILPELGHWLSGFGKLRKSNHQPICYHWRRAALSNRSNLLSIYFYSHRYIFFDPKEFNYRFCSPFYDCRFSNFTFTGLPSALCHSSNLHLLYDFSVYLDNSFCVWLVDYKIPKGREFELVKTNND